MYETEFKRDSASLFDPSRFYWFFIPLGRVGTARPGFIFFKKRDSFLVSPVYRGRNRVRLNSNRTKIDFPKTVILDSLSRFDAWPLKIFLLVFRYIGYVFAMLDFSFFRVGFTVTIIVNFILLFRIVSVRSIFLVAVSSLYIMFDFDIKEISQ